MPKQKTNSSAKKRIRVTGSGKLIRERVNKQHKFEYKSNTRKRRISKNQLVDQADVPRMKRLLAR